MSEIPKPPSVIPRPPNFIPKPPLIIPKAPTRIIDIFGQVRELPHAIDAENAILGALLLQGKVMDEVVNILMPEFFHDFSNQAIYSAMKNLYEKSTVIDLVTVSDELKRIGKLTIAGGNFNLIQLIQKVSSSAHIEFHTRIVIQKYVLRRLILNAERVIKDSLKTDVDIFDLMDKIEADIATIYKNAIHTVTGMHLIDAKGELYKKVQAVKNGEPSGIITHIEEFDEWCGGFQFRELITLAARPGMGKTTAVLAIAANASFNKKIPIAFFSLEMAESDLKARLTAKGLGIPYTNIRLGKLTDVELSNVLEYYDKIDKSPLTIVDDVRIHENICKKIRDLVLKQGVKMVIIDYVQLIKLAKSSGDRTSDLSTITRDLKALANELSIPIIIVAQLNRKVDDRPNKRPQLSDLKQSGSIEEDSDTVIFLLRMAYYQTEAGVVLPPHIVGKTEMIVAKGRNTGTRVFWTFLDFKRYDFMTYRN